jgi:hypothetical protein
VVDKQTKNQKTTKPPQKKTTNNPPPHKKKTIHHQNDPIKQIFKNMGKWTIPIPHLTQKPVVIIK